MTTIQDLIDRTLRPMRDADQDFFSSAELLEYANDAMNDLASRELNITRTTTVNSVGGVISAPDSLFLRWRHVADVTLVTESAWYERQANEYDEVDAQIGFISDQSIPILPTPEDGTIYTVSYYALPTQADATADGIELYVIYEPKIVHYMRSRCYARLGEESLSQFEMSLYERGLRPPRGLENPRPGPWTLSREVGVFDNDPEVAHLGFPSLGQ